MQPTPKKRFTSSHVWTSLVCYISLMICGARKTRIGFLYSLQIHFSWVVQGTLDSSVDWGYKGIMEKKMERTILQQDIYWGYSPPYVDRI